jgi:hypothetical protein
MANKELESKQICKILSHISSSDWVAVKFQEHMSVVDIDTARFWEAVYRAQNEPEFEKGFL